MSYWETDAEFMWYMMSNGYVVSTQWDDEENDMKVLWNMERLKADFPDVHKVLSDVQVQQVEATLSELVDDGMLEMVLEVSDGEPEIKYQLTDAGRAAVEELRDDQL